MINTQDISWCSSQNYFVQKLRNTTSTQMVEQIGWFPSESLMQMDDMVPNKRRKLSDDHDQCK